MTTSKYLKFKGAVYQKVADTGSTEYVYTDPPEEDFAALDRDVLAVASKSSLVQEMVAQIADAIVQQDLEILPDKGSYVDPNTVYFDLYNDELIEGEDSPMDMLSDVILQSVPTLLKRIYSADKVWRAVRNALPSVKSWIADKVSESRSDSAAARRTEREYY